MNADTFDGRDRTEDEPGYWLRLTEVDNIKRIIINANSGKAITATRGE